jgi:hypothetical protein
MTIKHIEGFAGYLRPARHGIQVNAPTAAPAARNLCSIRHAFGASLFTGRVAQLATLTIRHAVPVIYGYGEFARAGGLMSYGASIAEHYRLVGSSAGRILKGEKPSDSSGPAEEGASQSWRDRPVQDPMQA